jgi:hypothetical protein
MRIIAFTTYNIDIRKNLEHIRAATEPTRITLVRGPPLWGGCDLPMDEGAEVEPDWDEAAQPVPDFEVEQRIGCKGRQPKFGQLCGTVLRLSVPKNV